MTDRFVVSAKDLIIVKPKGGDNEMAAKTAKPELSDEQRQEQKRAKWRAYYAKNKAKYAEWGKRWRERQKAASPPPDKVEKPKRAKAAKKGPARDEHGRFVAKQ